MAEWPHYFNISPFSFQIAWGMQALTFQHHLKFSCWENLREVSFSQIVGVSGYWREHGGREKCLFQFQPVDLIHRLAYACFKHKKSTYWNTELTTTCQSDRFWWKRVCAKKNKPIKYYFCWYLKLFCVVFFKLILDSFEEWKEKSKISHFQMPQRKSGI